MQKEKNQEIRKKSEMKLTLDDEKRHSFQQMRIQSSIKIHLSDAKAKHGVYPNWQARRMTGNQGESAQSLADRSVPLKEAIAYAERVSYQRGKVLNNRRDSLPLNSNFTSLPNLNKLGDNSTYFNISVNRQPTPFHQPSPSKQSTVITNKVRNQHHHTPIAPYRRLPLSYRQSAKKIARKPYRLFDDILCSNKDQLKSSLNNSLQDHHRDQEDQLGNKSIRVEEMTSPNPLCIDLAHLPTIESADEATSPPSTPGTHSSGHYRNSSVFSGRRSSTTLSTHGETFRSLKGKGKKAKASSAWDEEETQKKPPLKTFSRWTNLGANSRVEKKRARSDVTFTPKYIPNNSVSSIDLSSNNSTVISPKEPGELLRKTTAGVDSLSPLLVRTSEPDFFSNSFGSMLKDNGSTQSLTTSFKKGIKPCFEIQTRPWQAEQKDRIPEYSASMEGGDQEWNNCTTPTSPDYPASIASSKKISSTTRGQVRRSGDSSLRGSTIQTPPSPTQEILWDSKRKIRSQTTSTFSSVSTWSNNSGTDFVPSMDNALLQGLQSPIGSLDIACPPSNAKRVSKNIGVQNIRKTATKLHEALRESEEIEEKEEAKEKENKTNVNETSPNKSPSSQHSSLDAPARSSIFMPPTPTKSNSMPITIDNLQTDNKKSSVGKTLVQDADDRPNERREVAYSPRGEDLEAYNKFLRELQADLGHEEDQDDADNTITVVKQIPILKKTRRHRSSTTHKDQLFAFDRTQVAKPRRSCASLTVDKPITTSSKTSLSSYSDSDEVTTNEYEPSQACSSETGSSNIDGLHHKNGDQDGETEDSDAMQDEEILQSSVESSISYATIDQTADAQLEMLDCRIQSIRRLDITATVPPSPRMIRSDSQQSLLSQAKAIIKEDQEVKRNSAPSLVSSDHRTPSETLCNQTGTQSLHCEECQIQSVDVEKGNCDANMIVTLNWTSTIDSNRLIGNQQSINESSYQSKSSKIVHGKLQLDECEVERIARAWIDTQIGQMQREQALSSSEGLRKASDQLSLGLTEAELRKVNKSVLEQRQREILASAYASTLHNRDQIREKMASERMQRDRHISTTSSEDSCKQKRRSLHLKPDQIPSPGLFIDTEMSTISDPIRTLSLNNSPNRFHPLISPISTTSSARQSFNSIASYKRLSPKKLRE